MRIAHFGPLPPLRSGISDYCSALLPQLAKIAEVDLWVGQDAIALPSIQQFRVVNYLRSPGRLSQLKEYDALLFHMGNNAEFHSNIYEVLLEYPGVVVLHDYVLHHFMAGYYLNGKRSKSAYVDEFRYNYGELGVGIAEQMFDTHGNFRWQSRYIRDCPLNKRVLDHATGIIVHSEFAHQSLVNHGLCPARVVPFLNQAVSAVRSSSDARMQLRLPTASFIVATFGSYGHHKRVPQMMEAFSLFRERNPEAILLLVGWGYPEDEIQREVMRQGLDPYAVQIILSATTDEIFEAYMAAADVCLCLRFPTMGETSGTVLRAMALQKAVLVTDVGWYSELPDDTVWKIPPDSFEVEILAETLLEIWQHPDLGSRLGHNASDYVLRHHDPAKVAQNYIDFVAESVSPKKTVQNRLASLAGDAIAELTTNMDVLTKRAATCIFDLTGSSPGPGKRFNT